MHDRVQTPPVLLRPSLSTTKFVKPFDFLFAGEFYDQTIYLEHLCRVLA